MKKNDLCSKFEYIISKIGESPTKCVSSFPNREHSMLKFLCILKIILVYSKVIFLYINWLIWVYLNCFEYTLNIWVYLKIYGHSNQILRKQMD